MNGRKNGLPKLNNFLAKTNLPKIQHNPGFRAKNLFFEKSLALG